MADIQDLMNFLIYLKQGQYCEDCDDTENICKCNYCIICDEKICICNIKDIEDKNEIDIYVIKWILYNISKIGIENLISNFSNYSEQHIFIRKLKIAYENKLV